MKSASIAVMAVRLKRLPRHHRIAHLRALIEQESAPSIRRLELEALLRDEMAPQSKRETRAI
jgi:hypothetical protein